jgi:quercetin dioxygenase-like cupin family protein
MKRASLLLFLTSLLLAQSPQEVEITAEPNHHLVFQNEQIRVFDVQIPARADTLMHRHRHDYAFVTIGTTDIATQPKDHPPVQVHLQDGEARFASAPIVHVVRNLSDHTFRNIDVEYLQDEKLRAAVKSGKVHWNEARGLDILDHGTKEIVSVDDGVRITLIELQPGGMVPQHHHDGPYLLVALSDVELQNDVKGKGAATLSLKQGETKWFPGSETHSVMNMSKHDVKFVALEFPTI